MLLLENGPFDNVLMMHLVLSLLVRILPSIR